MSRAPTQGECPINVIHKYSNVLPMGSLGLGCSAGKMLVVNLIGPRITWKTNTWACL